ncbi:uncharacterized protein LOC129939939 [Eupeodes corollae]|uniref:uncharacterized protein LOC129939939 n=1 Tax=Eupeodes corollae TaxID=290404 RepID=UPI0024928523|nr:uncharacterized protein LOC129939939 [Eupeodes corollae]
MICSKLGNLSLDKWIDVRSHDRLSTLEELKKFLETRACNVDERLCLALTAPTSYTSKNGKPQPKKEFTQHQTSLVAVHEKLCSHCPGTRHNIYRCKKFLELSPEQRYNSATNLKLCLNCLKTGHVTTSCSIDKCRTCNQLHHTLLHGHSKPTPVMTSPIIKDKPISSTSIGTSLLSKNTKIRYQMPISGIGNSVSTNRHAITTSIYSRYSKFSATINLYVLPQITGNHPDSFINVDEWDILKKFDLADPLFHRKSKIDMLIGAKLIFNILKRDQYRLTSELPILQSTELGWEVAGKLQPKPPSLPHCNVATTPIPRLSSLEKTLQKFWDLEDYKASSKTLTEEEEEYIRQMFRQILIHEDDRKYQMILWRDHPNELLKYYLLNTVTYGTSSAPFLATTCIVQLAEEEEVHLT